MVDSQGSSVTSLHASLLIGGGAPYETANRTSMKQKATAEMFEQMGLGDQAQVVNIMVQKIGNNLKYWADAEEVLSGTLGLFLEVSSGGASGKILLGLDTIQFLIQNHTPEHFPFLLHPQNYKQRTALHATLARLIFHQVSVCVYICGARAERLTSYDRLRATIDVPSLRPCCTDRRRSPEKF